MSQIEIERRFLLAELPPDWAGQARASRIEQAYLLIEEDGRELRMRRRDGACSLAVKSGQGLSRQEQEQAISAELFDMLWPLTAGRRLEKTRYELMQAGHLFEVDVYAGDLAPLCVLEVEFTSLDQARAFTPPAQALRELTEDPRYRNASLALASSWERQRIVKSLSSP